MKKLNWPLSSLRVRVVSASIATIRTACLRTLMWLANVCSPAPVEDRPTMMAMGILLEVSMYLVILVLILGVNSQSKGTGGTPRFSNNGGTTGEEKSFKKWGGWTASAGSRIYKTGGHKIMDFLSITKTSRWEVVKNSAFPKRPFFFFGLHAIFPILQAFPVQIITTHTFSSISWYCTYIFECST